MFFIFYLSRDTYNTYIHIRGIHNLFCLRSLTKSNDKMAFSVGTT